MKKDDLKFTIDQLRKDKIIYAIEACATNLICILIFLFSTTYFSGILKNIINIAVLGIAISYTLYMGVGNFFRLTKVKKLEKELFNSKSQ